MPIWQSTGYSPRWAKILKGYMGLGKTESPQTSVFSLLGNVIIFIAVYLYFAGWVYAYYYFERFGIPLVSVDIPFYYFFIYSFSVIITNKLVSIIIFIAIVGIDIFFTRRPNGLKLVKKWITISFLIGLVVLFFYLAKASGERKAVAIKDGRADTISFVFKKGVARDYPKEFLDASARGNLRLVTQTKDVFYVIYQPPGEKGASSLGYSYVISRTDVYLARIEYE